MAELDDLKTSIAGIHYHAKRLYQTLNRKDRIEEATIAYSILMECESRIPELNTVFRTKVNHK